MKSKFKIMNLSLYIKYEMLLISSILFNFIIITKRNDIITESY